MPVTQGMVDSLIRYLMRMTPNGRCADRFSAPPDHHGGQAYASESVRDGPVCVEYGLCAQIGVTLLAVGNLVEFGDFVHLYDVVGVVFMHIGSMFDDPTRIIQPG